MPTAHDRRATQGRIHHQRQGIRLDGHSAGMRVYRAQSRGFIHSCAKVGNPPPELTNSVPAATSTEIRVLSERNLLPSTTRQSKPPTTTAQVAGNAVIAPLASAHVSPFHRRRPVPPARPPRALALPVAQAQLVRACRVDTEGAMQDRQALHSETMRLPPLRATLLRAPSPDRSRASWRSDEGFQVARHRSSGG